MKKHAAAVRSTVFLAVAVFAIGANAETLLWYRFDESDGATIVNKANPGTMNGTLKSIVWGQGVGNQGNDSTKFPKRGNAFPEGTGIIDPASDMSYSGQVKSLSFTGDQSTAGMVLLTKANATQLLNLTSFTCEVFFKIPAAAKTRTPALFPILTFGEEGDTSKQGWKFGFFRSSGTKLSPWFRGTTKTSTGAKGSVVTVNAANGNKDNYTYDTWHHLALVVDGAGDGSTATAKLILDYTEVHTGTIESYYGFYFDPKGGFPLTIGADMYRNRDDKTKRETFMGDIAEFRISNTALATDDLLRPLPTGPVDADTLVYLPMGDCDWFGSPNTASYKNIYHGVLNAAPTAAYTPYWFLNSSAIPYPAVSSYAAGGMLRDGYLSTETYADVKSMNFSRALGTTEKEGDQYFGHVVRIPYENAHLADGSFTMEWFFKTDGQIPSGNEINSYTFMNNSFAKIMINRANGFLLTRLVPNQGDYTDNNSAVRVDDGKWHHYALVYNVDQGSGTIAAYLDYGKIFSKGFTLTPSTTAGFYFGGEGRYKQAFSGCLDDFRITRRALRADEFLTTREHALFAKFEGDYTTGQDFALASDGVGGTLGGGSEPTFVDVNRRVDLDGDGKEEYVSKKALSLDGGSVVYPHNLFLESRNFTAEWFAKYESLPNLSMILRFGEKSETGNGIMCWALYTPAANPTALRMGAYTSIDGTWERDLRIRSDKDFEGLGAVADGKWHHWALVAKTNPDDSPANTTFRLYRDYEQVGNALVYDGKDHAGGILALPSTGTTLSIGTSGNAINGVIDELRITPKVLEPEKFMHKLPSGLVLTLR